MLSEPIESLDYELDAFLESCDAAYKKVLNQVPMFSCSDSISTLSSAQKQRFIKMFYHIRGHFHDFLWYLVNYAPNEDIKALILDNIAEESGRDRHSHELLYDNFAQEFGVDSQQEMLNEDNHLPFIRAYNKAHLSYLVQHDFDHCFCAYSAYERLDNIDYDKLYQFAKNIGTSKQGLIFFDVHRQVEHFETTESYLLKYWQKNSDIVKKSYQFIYQTQIKIWTELSEHIYLTSEC